MAGKVVGYVRVSSLDQSTERQLEGVKLDRRFIDKASGKDANRPQLQECLRYLRDEDTLMVHSMDRLARNVEDMLRLVGELTAKGVTVTFVKESLTFSGDATPMNRLMLTLLGAFAEFERNLIRERQREGIAIAKAKGAYKGRAPSLTAAQVTQLYELLDTGVPKTKVAAKLKVTRQTVYEYDRKRQSVRQS